jgi:hypothetical protein
MNVRILIFNDWAKQPVYADGMFLDKFGKLLFEKLFLPR